MSIGKRLATVREHAGLNQSELARRCGVRPSAISMIESGTSKSISASLLFAIAEVLRVNVVWLQTGKGEPYAAPDREARDPILDVLAAMPVADAAYWRSRLETELKDIQRGQTKGNDRQTIIPKVKAS